MEDERRKNASVIIIENNGRTDGVVKSSVKGVRDHSASLLEPGTSRMITLEVIVRGIEVSQSSCLDGEEQDP
ncbi:unnamed protein product [Thelazia callipaeda]|uniref:TRAM domain-containing protein n=1 Tax=Thelazia callipaeda TaxID=103827 RepID=A0A0N5D5D2_THECL|nr:unnamed protein product [Thelazia callipaeda]